MSFNLRDAVRVQVIEGNALQWRDGMIVGRTLEERPRYDVRFADGTVAWNVTGETVRAKDRAAA